MRVARDFEAVLRSGNRLASRNFVLRALPNEVGHARLGIIAGRKVAVRAVDRNRAKRLIRDAFRSVSKKLGGYDLTLQLRNDLRSESRVALRTELDTLLETFRRRCDGPALQSSR